MQRIYTQDGEQWLDDNGNPIPPQQAPTSPAGGNVIANAPHPVDLSNDIATPPGGYGQPAYAQGGGAFTDRLKAALQQAYPNRSKDQNWLNSQVQYFLGQQAKEGPQYNEDYWLKRAMGWQAGGGDVAEAGDYAPGGKFGPGGGDLNYTQGANLDWFDQNAPPMEPYTTPDRPSYLQGEYKPPTWNETFTPPDAKSLYQDPGYQARLDAAQKAMQRSAAAKGSILSGGTQVALGNQAQDIASQEYGNAFNRALGAYTTRYGQFTDAAQLGLQARGVNENAYNTDVANSRNQYGLRYNAYRDAIGDRFKLADYGLRALQAGAPGA